ncbi:MAG: carboxypeptidase regulatory-like domain-containing protein, partial [Candidatus Acidiferrum sp.]
MKWLAATLLGLLAFFSSVSALAQSGDEGSIEGFIIDPSGAVISGVNVTARNIHTAAIYRTVTNGDGRFRFLVLPVGTYEVTAEHPGFATLVDKGVVVTVGAKINLPLTLPLASQTQRVEVNSETPLVEPTRTGVSSTIDERSIANLPVNGRNFDDFIVLAPGVIRGPVLINFGSGIPSIGGQRSFSMTLVDGAENAPAFSDPFGPGIQPYQFSLEVVREFQVNTNSYSAELGHAGNGLISVITKSGTNDFHGSLFWYFRDKGLNATDLIRKINSQPKEPLHIHQFGGAGGGPILKNKVFLFAGYDAQRRQLQNLTLLNLPSGFILSSDATVAGFQQSALNYLTPRADPYIRTLDQDVYFAKVDWRITSTELLSARWNTQRFTGQNSFAEGQQLSLENNTDSLNTNHSLVLSLTSTISSAMVNVARFGYLLNDDKRLSNAVNPQANIFESGQQVLTVGHGPGGPGRTLVRQFYWSDTLSTGHSHHAFKFGVDVLLARNRGQNTPNFFGTYRFNSLESFGRSLAQLPVCNPPQNPAPATCRTPLANETYVQAFSGEEKPGTTTFPNSTEFAIFLQDEWRARTNLIFNLGLRYDIQVMAKPPVRNPSAALAAAGLD